MSGALSTPSHARASISLDPSFRFHGGGPIDNLRPPSEICFFVGAVADTAGPFLIPFVAIGTAVAEVVVAEVVVAEVVVIVVAAATGVVVVAAVAGVVVVAAVAVRGLSSGPPPVYALILPSA
jgi:hypothetical protein